MEPVTAERLGVRSDLAVGALDLLATKPGITLAVTLGLLLLRWALVRLIRGRAGYLSDRRRRWISIVRNGGVLLLIAIVGALWLPEARSAALSLAAVALAIVIATKELLLCLAGALLRSISGAFQTSDWIEVDGVSGEVAELDFLSTTLLEIDARRFEYTGRTITLPNAVFLTSRVTNHGFRKRFVFHEFTLYVEPGPGTERLRARLQATLSEASADFEDLAARYAALIEKRAGVRMPPTTPRVRLATTDFAKLAYQITLFCPRERALDMEAAAAAALAAWWDAEGAPAPASG